MAKPSAEARATPVVIDGKFGKRPEPPEELGEAQRAIWSETCASEPIDFFATHAMRDMLKDYCRHRAEAERISTIINSFQSDWIKNSEGAKRYNELLKMRERETRAACTMATKLRITNQSRYDPAKAATASRNTLKGIKPWEE